jgi:flagellar hook assembly protein FlgD
LLGSSLTDVGPQSPPGLRLPQLTAAPNPFNPQVQISFRSEKSGPIALHVYDVRGRRIVTLYEGPLAAGDQVLTWDGRDKAGRSVASGVYYLRLETAAGVAIEKIALVR